MMEPVLAPFTEVLRSIKFGEPQIPYVSNVTARWITPEEAQSPEYWAGHVRQAVRFADGVAELMKDARNVLLEVGPGQTLTTLARQHPAKPSEQIVLASLPPAGTPEDRGILETLGRLWMTGVTVDWDLFYANERRHRAVLPTYPFERKRYWPEAPRMLAVAAVATGGDTARTAPDGSPAADCVAVEQNPRPRQNRRVPVKFVCSQPRGRWWKISPATTCPAWTPLSIFLKWAWIRSC